MTAPKEVWFPAEVAPQNVACPAALCWAPRGKLCTNVPGGGFHTLRMERANCVHWMSESGALELAERLANGEAPKFSPTAPTMTRHGLGLSHSEITQACRNIGFDLTCGACAGVFYTGSGLGEHTCKPTPTELRQRLFTDANELEAIARRVREYVPGACSAVSNAPVEYPWTGTLSDKTRWTAVYESGVAEGRRLGRADVLSALRSGPPSGWCTYQIREGLAEEVANTIGLADGIVKEIKKEAGSSGV